MASLILLGALILVGGILWLFHKEPEKPSRKESLTSESPKAEDCCGMHAVCEKLNTGILKEIEYYDDEELDRFAGMNPNDYSMAQTEEFRDVLLTLLPADVAGWGASLQKRGISMPASLRDEYMMLLTESVTN